MPKKKRLPFFIQGKRRVRGAGNRPIKDKEHPYLKPGGTFDPQELLENLSDAPGAFDLLIIDHLIDKGELDNAYHYRVEEIVDALVQIACDAGTGDERATNQLRLIEKIIHPEKYELEATKIAELAGRYETPPQLARAWELRRLMSGLATVLEPVDQSKTPSVDDRVRLIIRKPKSRHELYYWERAKKHMKRNSTLQSLAIRIYLEYLQDEGLTDDESITERTLKRDLAKAREWENTTTEEQRRRRGHSFGQGFRYGPRIDWYDFSEGWKERKKKARAKRMTKDE